MYDRTMAQHAIALADAAVAACPRLPLVTGLNQSGEAPATWADESDQELADRCAEQIGSVERAIASYLERTGVQPGHQEQVAAGAFVAWAYDGDGELFVSSDFVGVDTDAGGGPVAAPVPGGVCDR